MRNVENWVPGLPEYEESEIPGVDNDLVIHSYPIVLREGSFYSEQEKYYRKLARKARRAKRPWWLRWY